MGCSPSGQACLFLSRKNAHCASECRQWHWLCKLPACLFHIMENSSRAYKHDLIRHRETPENASHPPDKARVPFSRSDISCRIDARRYHNRAGQKWVADIVTFAAVKG